MTPRYRAWDKYYQIMKKVVKLEWKFGQRYLGVLENKKPTLPVLQAG